MTGTGVVPSNDFTLHEGDEIEISIERIGTLRNIVAYNEWYILSPLFNFWIDKKIAWPLKQDQKQQAHLSW